MQFKDAIVEFVGSGRVNLTKVDLPLSMNKLRVDTCVSLISAGTESANLFYSNTGRFPSRPNATIVGRVTDRGVSKRILLKDRHCSAAVISPTNKHQCFIPHDISDEQALLARQSIVALQSLVISGPVSRKSICVIGLGIIGQLIIRWAVLNGVEEILGIDKHQIRLNAASSYANVENDVGVAPSNYFDIVFIACTDAKAVLHGLKICKPEGRIILAAAPSTKVSIDLANDIFRKSVTILGAHEVRALTGDATWQTLLDPIFDKIISKKILLDDLITHRFPVHDAALAYEFIGKRKSDCLGVVLIWH